MDKCTPPSWSMWIIVSKYFITIMCSYFNLNRFYIYNIGMKQSISRLLCVIKYYNENAFF